jgi:hypothetical protein
MSGTVNKALGAPLSVVVEFPNPGYSASVLRIDLENLGASAVAGWKVLAAAVPGAPLRDITPATLLSADGYVVVAPSPREAASLAAGANTQVALNVALWDRVDIQFQGAGAELRASWTGIE